MDDDWKDRIRKSEREADERRRRTFWIGFQSGLKDVQRQRQQAAQKAEAEAKAKQQRDYEQIYRSMNPPQPPRASMPRAPRPPIIPIDPQDKHEDPPDTLERKLQLVDAVDAAFAHRAQGSPSPNAPSETTVHPPLSLHALWDRWVADLLPYDDRVELLCLPTLTLGGEVPRRPFNSAYYLVILAVQPQGWTARERRRWRNLWLHWVISGGGTLDHRVDGLGFSTRTDSAPWVWTFTLRYTPQVDYGWQWGVQFPAIPEAMPAADATPLTNPVARALRVSLKNPQAIHLTTHERWSQSQLTGHVYPKLPDGAGTLDKLLAHVRYPLGTLIPMLGGYWSGYGFDYTLHTVVPGILVGVCLWLFLAVAWRWPDDRRWRQWFSTFTIVADPQADPVDPAHSP